MELQNHIMTGSHHAVSYLERQGAQGAMWAKTLVALRYWLWYGHVSLDNPVLAAKVLAAARMAAKSGDPIGDFVYGQELLSMGRGRHETALIDKGVRFTKRAIPLLREKAQLRCAATYQFLLANAYYYGAGVQMSRHTAFLWALRSAHNGSSLGQGLVGFYYTLGYGTKRNCALGLKWFRASAANGYPESRVFLGDMYRNGICVKRSPARAISLFRAAARSRLPSAYYSLGLAYARGVGVKKKYTRAFVLFQRATSQGSIQAVGWAAIMGEYLTAEALMAGKPVPIPPGFTRKTWTVRLLKSAADMGFRPAKTALAELQKG